MKQILLIAIRLYWWLVPPEKRSKCIYKHSCSEYVFDKTKEEGLAIGLRALWYRVKTCNHYFELSRNSVNNEIQILLSNGDLLNQAEIADRLLK